MNRKARRRALRAALSVHAARGSIAVLDGSGFDEPATKQAAQGLEKWGARTPTLVVLDPEEVAALKSFRNLPDVDVLAGQRGRRGRLIGHAVALDVLRPEARVWRGRILATQAPRRRSDRWTRAR